LAVAVVATLVGFALRPLHLSSTAITVVFVAPWWISAFARRLRRRREPAVPATAVGRGDGDDQQRVQPSREPDLVAQ
jgi:hypothetical protein